MFGPCFVIQFFIVLQYLYWRRESWVISSILIILLMYCECLCSVAHPHGAMGWIEVYDCGIS